MSPSWAKGGGEQHKNICCNFHSIPNSPRTSAVLSILLYFLLKVEPKTIKSMHQIKTRAIRGLLHFSDFDLISGKINASKYTTSWF